MALNDFSSFLETEFGELGREAVEKELLTGAEGSLKRKSTLSSFRLPSLMPKEKGIAIACHQIVVSWSITTEYDSAVGGQLLRMDLQ